MLKTYCVCSLLLLLVTDVVRCAPDYSYTFNSEARGWLKLYTTPKTWEDALLTCHNEGAVLASPLNKKVANVLRRLITQSGVNTHFFLGTHALFSKERFLSVEGVPLFALEATLASPYVNSLDCLSMSADGHAYYTSCNDTLPFICYKITYNQTMNECGTFDNEYHFNQRTGSCYKVHPEKMTWDRAFGICASEGGHLVIINDAEEASVVKDLFPKHSGEVDCYEQFHIGLVAWGKTRTWMSIHGQKIEDVFNVWNAGQPDQNGTQQTRTTFYRNSGKMDDIKPSASFMFLCEKSPIGNEELIY